jgi:hypothetical protein
MNTELVLFLAMLSVAFVLSLVIKTPSDSGS